ncbi:hypothetical protein HBA_0152 [Sodalis endosymbiont of Henestaris halophilus]|nr:hypothetical protein HBA_0152 [Sodalis endosymbiont of Henestaris halophilus]
MRLNRATIASPSAVMLGDAILHGRILSLLGMIINISQIAN